MKRIIKWLGIFLGGMIGIASIIFAVFALRVEWKRNAVIETTIQPIGLPEDDISLAEGRRLVQVKACADCHGVDMGGKSFINEPAIAILYGSNLTTGKGSAVADYTITDWIRSIRYAIGPDGKPLLGMTSGDYHQLTNEDLSRMIAYLITLPPVDRSVDAPSIGPVGRVLYNLGQLPLLFPFEEVNLQAAPPEQLDPAPTVQYGQYVAMACTGCHGSGFAGGHIPGTPPTWPDASNLTPGGRLANWSKSDFEKALREGLTPEGRQIDSQYMPWKAMQAMTEIEVQALYQFLKQLPAKPTGTR